MMGKRSNFPRRSKDVYDTPAEAVTPLLRHLPSCTLFYEPCAGRGDLVRHLENAGHICVRKADIEPRAPDVFQEDALAASVWHPGLVITNPPWHRPTLHAMIAHFVERNSAWLLLDANWMFTKQAAPYLEMCSKIVTVGRVRWIPESKMTGKDDCAWFLFERFPAAKTVFYGQTNH